MSSNPSESKKKSPTITIEGFCCSLTGELMRDPVIATNGLSYETSAVADFLRDAPTDDDLRILFISSPPQKNVFLRRAIESSKNLLEELETVSEKLAAVQQQCAELEKLDRQQRLAKASRDKTTTKDSKNLPGKKSSKKNKLGQSDLASPENIDDPLLTILKELEDDPPGGFECIVHSCMMTNPMFCMDGASYDSGVIEALMAEENSPWTRQKLTDKQSFPNLNLKNAIKDYPKKILQLKRSKIKLQQLTAQVAKQQTLIDQHATLPAVDQTLSPLILEILKSDYSPTLEQLLLSKEDIHLKLSGYSLAECIALYAPWPIPKKTEFLKKLTAKGIKLAPLFFAATLGLEKMFQTETNKKGLRLIDDHGCHALHYAAANGHKNIVQLLLSQTRFALTVSEKNDAGDTALMFAAQNARLEMLSWLVSKYQASLTEQNKSGQDLRFKAEQACQPLVLDWLNQQGYKPAELKKNDTPHGPSPYRQAAPDATPGGATPQGARPSPYRQADRAHSVEVDATPGAATPQSARLSPYRQADRAHSVEVHAYLGIDPETVLTTAAGRKFFSDSQLVKESKISRYKNELYLAADKGQTEKVKEVLAALSDDDQRREAILAIQKGKSFPDTNALYAGSANGHTETVLTMLNALSKTEQQRAVLMLQGSKIPLENTHILFIAAVYGHTDLVMAMLAMLDTVEEQRQAILMPQSKGNNVLCAAAIDRQSQLVIRLLTVLGTREQQQKAILKPLRPNSDENILWSTILYGRGENAITLLAILSPEQQKDAILQPKNVGDISGVHALYATARKGNAEIMYRLLAILNQDQRRRIIFQPQGAGPEEGYNMLHGAILSENVATVKNLLLALRPIDQQQAILTPLYSGECCGLNALGIAVLNQQVEIVSTLLKALEPKQQATEILRFQGIGSLQGINTLFIATRHGNIAMVNLLLSVMSPTEQQQAILMPQNKGPFQGINPLRHSIDNGAREMTSMLQSYLKPTKLQMIQSSNAGQAGTPASRSKKRDAKQRPAAPLAVTQMADNQDHSSTFSSTSTFFPSTTTRASTLRTPAASSSSSSSKTPGTGQQQSH